MSLEAYTGKIADLVITNPTPTDPKSQGDDHLRGIKKTIVDDAVRVSGSPLQQMGASATASENHHWNASVANQLTLKRGVPDAPGATVIQVVDGKVVALASPQIWQDVTTLRTWGQDFVNDTGLPIQVSCHFTNTTGVNLGAYGVVGGVQVNNIFLSASPDTTSLGFSFNVPAGATYSVHQSGASAAVWTELR